MVTHSSNLAQRISWKRSLVGSSPQGCKELDMTKTTHTQTYCLTDGKHSVCVQFSSVAQSCPTLCDPMNRSTPGLPVHHYLPEFTQTHVHRVCDAIQPSHPGSSPSPPAPNPSQHQSFPMRTKSILLQVRISLLKNKNTDTESIYLMVKDNQCGVTIIRQPCRSTKYIGLTYISSSLARWTFSPSYICQDHSSIVLATSIFSCAQVESSIMLTVLRNNKIPKTT